MATKTNEQVKQGFAQFVLPSLRKDFGSNQEAHALAWRKWVGRCVNDGLITQAQYQELVASPPA